MLQPLCLQRNSGVLRQRYAPGPANARLVSQLGRSVRAPASRRVLPRCRAAVSQPVSEEDKAQAALIEVTRRIKRHGSAGRWREAVSELAGLSQLGLQPDLQAATALVAACSRNMEVAQSIFDELFSSLLTPDEVVFAVLVRGYGGLNPPDWVKIDAVLTRMRNEYGIDATATVYNALLEVCVKTSDWERGTAVIDRMVADGVEPDEFTGDIVASRKNLRSYLRKCFG